MLLVGSPWQSVRTPAGEIPGADNRGRAARVNTARKAAPPWAAYPARRGVEHDSMNASRDARVMRGECGPTCTSSSEPASTSLRTERGDKRKTSATSAGVSRLSISGVWSSMVVGGQGWTSTSFSARALSLAQEWSKRPPRRFQAASGLQTPARKGLP